MTIKFLSSELSPFGARLRLSVAFKRLAIPFEAPPGGSASAELKALTPFGRIPVLLENGKVLVESLALLDYLEDAYPTARSLRPQDPHGLARARMIALLFDHNVIKALGGVFAQFPKPVPDIDAVRTAFDEVERELAKVAYFFDPAGPAVGGEISIADCALVPFANVIDRLSAGFDVPSPLARVPRFKQWWADLGALPEVTAVVSPIKALLDTLMAAKKGRPAG